MTDGADALYAIAPGFTDDRPAGDVRVREVVATTAGSRAAIWGFLLALDLRAS